MSTDLRAVTRLPDSGRDPRGDQTALAVALGGAICPVPFVMSAAALRITGAHGSSTARAARGIARATIVLQAVGLLALAFLLLR